MTPRLTLATWLRADWGKVSYTKADHSADSHCAVFGRSSSPSVLSATFLDPTMRYAWGLQDWQGSPQSVRGAKNRAMNGQSRQTNNMTWERRNNAAFPQFV